MHRPRPTTTLTHTAASEDCSSRRALPRAPAACARAARPVRRPRQMKQDRDRAQETAAHHTRARRPGRTSPRATEPPRPPYPPLEVSESICARARKSLRAPLRCADKIGRRVDAPGRAPSPKVQVKSGRRDLRGASRCAPSNLDDAPTTTRSHDLDSIDAFSIRSTHRIASLDWGRLQDARIGPIGFAFRPAQLPVSKRTQRG